MCAYYTDIAQDGLPHIQKNGRLFRELGLKVEDLEFRAQSPSGGRQIAEMQDELRTYRMEAKKKDDLIQKLCTVPCKEITPPSYSSRHVDYRGSSFHQQASSADIAAFQIKLDALDDKLRRRDLDLQTREERIAAVTAEKTMLEAEVARLTTLLVETRREADEGVGFKETYASLKARNEYAVTALQEQYRGAQDRALDLETRIRTHLDSREVIEVEKDVLATKFKQLMSDISRLTDIEEVEDIGPSVTKITEVMQEKALLESRVTSLTETLATRDGELAACKETITRVMADGSKDSVGYTSYSAFRVSYKAEAERLAAVKDDLEAQVLLLEKRVEANHRVTASLREELQQASTQLTEVEADRREKAFAAESGGKQFTALIDSLAAIIATVDIPCESTEAAVKDRVKIMTKDLKDQTAAVEALDQRCQALQRQFESQYEKNRNVEDRARHSELERLEMEERVKMMDSEMAARDVLREGMREDKDRICRQLQRVADMLGAEYAPDDLDPEYLISLIQGRVQDNLTTTCNTTVATRGRSSRLRGGATSTCTHRAGAGQCSTVTQLNQELASLREQMTAKDRQMDALKRETALRATDNHRRLHDCAPAVRTVHCHPTTERACSPCRFAAVCETPRDRVARLHDQLECSRVEIASLKDAILHSEDIQANLSAEHDSEMQSFTKNLEKIEKVRQRQARKIASLKEEVGRGEEVDELTKQMKNIRAAYGELARKEKHGSEFRSTLAHLLAVDLYMGGNPDGEMLTRVNRLLQACTASGIKLPTGPIQPSYCAQAPPLALQPPVSQAMWPQGDTTKTIPSRGTSAVKSAVIGSNGGKSKPAGRSSSPNKARDDRKY